MRRPLPLWKLHLRGLPVTPEERENFALTNERRVQAQKRRRLRNQQRLSGRPVCDRPPRGGATSS